MIDASSFMIQVLQVEVVVLVMLLVKVALLRRFVSRCFRRHQDNDSEKDVSSNKFSSTSHAYTSSFKIQVLALRRFVSTCRRRLRRGNDVSSNKFSPSGVHGSRCHGKRRSMMDVRLFLLLALSIVHDVSSATHTPCNSDDTGCAPVVLDINGELSPLSNTSVPLQNDTSSLEKQQDVKDRVKPLIDEDDDLIIRIRDWRPPKPLPNPPDPHEWIHEEFDLMPPPPQVEHQYEDECYDLSGSCAECLNTLKNKCGWCDNEKTCLARDSKNPLHLGMSDDCGSSWIDDAKNCPNGDVFPKLELPKNLVIDHTPMRRGPGDVLDSECVGFQGTEGDCERAKADGTLSQVRDTVLPQKKKTNRDDAVIKKIKEDTSLESIQSFPKPKPVRVPLFLALSLFFILLYIY